MADNAKIEQGRATALTEAQLDEVQGGIAMLLPAVQQAREAARKTNTGGTNAAFGDGSVKFITDSVEP